MCQQNKRVKDLLLASGDAAAAAASDDDNNELSPFEFAVFANSPSQSTTGFTWQATALENKPKTIIDTSTLNEQDLELLKEQDPFLYFSIPAVHHAAVVRNSGDIDIDMSDLQGSRSKATSRRASCPSRIEQSWKTNTKIERKSRISFECHTDLLLEELMDDFDDMSMQEFQDVKMDAQQ
jgi:hypothetical protein